MGVNIQWFPGHMAKAIRQFEENVHLVDIIFELVDARAPFSSMNPEVARIGVDKPHLLILTKADLADAHLTKQWIKYFDTHGYTAIAVDSKQNGANKLVTQTAQSILRPKLAAELKRGMKQRPIKAICVGVPNVGKSTLLNRLVQKRAAQVGNRPGVTKGQQWLRSSKDLELLDTPGILWPKFQNQAIANKLALTGAIKDNLYASDDIALFALAFFSKHRQTELMTRYRLTDADLELSTVDLLLKITKQIGMRDDYERASVRLIQDVRKGKLGRFTLDSMDLVDPNE
ncbi:ribosome biogenesis GTPase YlqF [Nicoliella spurrieriana]|uniref:Ribosome biogenesis GTPase A n=1 Tax=Nicoliella spurrieriana TaxID=2925830 RepID=A0A976RRP7_9LACO|nr:ribosome biogenesis GTPase YlqF [Nicoliella spurrieriana]UQS86573.1 ribosome biogenesis GTPase YlqF [Nicoliella spurrieriana]